VSIKVVPSQELKETNIPMIKLNETTNMLYFNEFIIIPHYLIEPINHSVN
jgi:hypothetical protein